MLRDAPQGAHITYSQQFRRCNKPDCPTCRQGRGHGPYWYAYWREDGRLRTRYLGRNAPPGADTQATAPPVPVAADVAPTLSSSPAGAPASTPRAAVAAAPYPPLRVRTLGGFAVWRGDEAMAATAWARRKVALLFKCLLSAPGQRVPREYALETLWPDEDPAVSGRNLRLTLYRLRRALGETGNGPGYVLAEGDVLMLVPAPADTPAPDWLDAAAFDRAATAALAGQDAAACGAALALYTGDYLPDDSYEEWAVPRREALRQRYLTLLLHLAGLRERQGAPDQATRCLRAVLAVDPGHEPATRALMRVQAATGQLAEALRTYQRLAGTLRRELDLAPDVETQAQYRALLAAQAAAAARQTNLPTPLTTFVGRGEELSALLALLGRAPQAARPDDGAAVCRLLTLTGAGGCGKTRLAVELGRRLLGAYTDGVWIVELAALDDAALIVPEVSRVLRVSEQAQQPPLESLAAELCGRELVLILDNCEHLIAECARVATALLSACPSLQILATSREALGVLGETVWPVPSLAVADPRRPLAPRHLAEYASARLFTERARAVQPAFALTAENSRAVAAICHQLDGIPLAIELAAARLATLSVADLAARLDDRLRLLAGGNRAALPRHQTLRAVLDWSYALLDQAERTLLQRLPVFAGGWPLEAAEAVCAGGEIAAGDVLDLLDRLVRKSLVQVEEVAAARERPRYRLLETVRQYAHERASAADEQRALRDAHLAWALDLAERGQVALQGPERPRWLALLELEHDNLRLALSWCAGEGRQPEAGLRLATALASFWDCSGYLAEARAWFDLFLEIGAASAGADEATQRRRSVALGRAAPFSYRQGDDTAALALMEEGLALARQLGDQSLIAGFTNNMGLVFKERRDYERATASFEQCMALDQATGDQRGVLIALCNLAWVAHARGDYAAAATLAEQCLARCRAQGESEVAAYALGHLACAAYALGELDRAVALFRETLRAACELGVRWGIAVCLEGLARVHARQGRLEQAVRWWGAAAALREDIGAPLSAEDRLAYDYDRAIAQARPRLGEAPFAAGWAAGQAIGVERAIAEALDDAPSHSSSPAS